MRRSFIFLTVLILCSSFRFDLNGPWVETKKGNITLFTRPEGYSKSPSPDSSDILKILSAQLEDVELINEKLKSNFHSEVKIYLFNHDEAKEKIRTNSGGGAKIKIREMYFAFNKDLVDKMDDFIGLHEMVHIISSNELGYPPTHLMNEGYANAISDGYKLRLSENGKIVRTSLEQWMTDLSKTENMLTPSEMLKYGDKLDDDVFYPQAGYFINWLMNEYGIETTNSIYPLRSKKIKKRVLELTDKNFEVIEKEYLMHIRKFR